MPTSLVSLLFLHDTHTLKLLHLNFALQHGMGPETNGKDFNCSRSTLRFVFGTWGRSTSIHGCFSFFFNISLLTSANWLRKLSVGPPLMIVLSIAWMGVLTIGS